MIMGLFGTLDVGLSHPGDEAGPKIWAVRLRSHSEHGS